MILWPGGSHASNFPHVARAARTVLSIPASSTLAERIVSTAGKIFRPEKKTDSKLINLNSLFSSSVTNAYIDNHA